MNCNAIRKLNEKWSIKTKIILVIPTHILQSKIMSDVKYHKIKHLVEVEDDILAVFTLIRGKQNQIENLSIAKNANITRNFVDSIFNKLKDKLENIKRKTDMSTITGPLKWTIYETDRIRILIIYETDCAVITLIKSNTSLSKTVDNILGYYYE
jgi:IMP dehydrogenase/GMP reductase